MGSTLEAYPLQFEDIPQKRYNKTNNNRKRGGKDSKMSKEVKQPEVKNVKKYAKTRGEHIKDLVITALIVGILAFVAGMTFQNKQQDAINQAMKSVAPSAFAQEQVKK